MRMRALPSPERMADHAVVSAGAAVEKLHKVLANIERVERYRYRTPPEVTAAARSAVQSAIHQLSTVVAHESGHHREPTP